MKKVLTAVAAGITALALALSMAACGEKQEIEMVNVDLSSEEYAFAVKKDDSELLASVNQFFKDKETEVSDIFTKYTADGVNLDSFGTEVQMEATGSDDELVVATNLDFAPFEYTVGNKVAGIDMEIAQLLADYLGKTLVVENMDFDSVVMSVANIDKYDIGIAGLTITPERADVVNFSDPYFGATQVIITKKGDTTFEGLTTAEEIENKLKTLTDSAAKCGGQKGTTSQFYINGSADFGFDGFSNLTFSTYDSAALAVTDMLNGNLAFVVVDKTTAQALVNSFNG